jgi:hypothetical protein
MLRHREPVDLGPIRFAIDIPEGATPGTNVPQRGTGPPAPHFAPSPDGRRLAYVMFSGDGKPQLWLRRFDALDGQPLRGTEDATFPFWSPDGRFVAFFAQGKLKKIDASGGSAQTIADAPAGEGGTWNRDDDIIFAPDETTGLLKVSASGGIASAVTTLDAGRGESSHRWPQFLPDGRHFLYLAMTGPVASSRGRAAGAAARRDAGRGIYIGSLDSAQRTLLREGTLRAQYAAGYLLFLRDSTLMAHALDVASLRLSGEPVSLAEGVAFNSANGRTGFAVSESGVLVYRSEAVSGGMTQLAWFDRSGRRLDQVGQPGYYSSLRLSPDQKRLAVNVRSLDSNAPADTWILELARGAIPLRITLTPVEREAGLAWSPDGSRIAYASEETGDLYQKATNGVGDPEVVLKSPEPKRPGAWSPDGRYIAFSRTSHRRDIDIVVVPVSGDHKPAAFLQTEFNEFAPAISPDGRWLAFNSDKGGVSAVYVRPFPSGDREWRVSPDGVYPLWRADGQELFYVSQRALMAVSVKPGATPEFGIPMKLFDAPFVVNRGIGSYDVVRGIGSYDVAANGQRFLIIEQRALTQGSRAAPFTVVLNWTAALKKND